MFIGHDARGLKGWNGCRVGKVERVEGGEVK